MKYNVLIVDDEPLAREIIESHLADLDQFNIVGSCHNAIEANEILQKENIDLMFLDIQMPKMTGIEFLKSLQQKPEVIMTTAYSDYAMEGYDLNVIDYLLKPISFERFMQAINKFTSKHQSSVGMQTEDDFFFVKADKKMVKIHFDDILYIEGLKDYVIIKKSGSRVITLQTMKSLQSKLPSSIFLRIHRSYIVNISKINAVFGSVVEIMDSQKPVTIPVGKSYKDTLINLINEKQL